MALLLADYLGSGRDIRPAARIASSCMAVSTGPDAILTIAPPPWVGCTSSLARAGIEWALCEIGKDELPAVGEEGLGDRNTDCRGPAGDDSHAAGRS
jgi:hypothetical protein